jgi:hypothetical protein
LGDVTSTAAGEGEFGGDGALRAQPRREIRVALLLAIVLAAAVLWEPILRIGTHTLGSWDYLSQSCSVTRTEPGRRNQNQNLSDPVLQFLPWSNFASEELAAGRAPLWNPYNGCGVPLIANYQSGVYSPFNLPFWILPLKIAALLSAAGKLAVAAAFSYLFLRALGRSTLASVFGAVAYACAGFQLMCVQHPHVGGMAFAPGTLLFAELALQDVERRVRSGAPGLPWLAACGVAATLGAGALAGHPETLLVTAVLVGLWCATRIVAGLARTRSPRVALSGLLLVGAAGVGAGMSAAQVLPFVEYSDRSAAAAIPDRTGTTLHLDELELQVFPGLNGLPHLPPFDDRFAPWPHIQESASFYVGALVLAFALLAMARPRVVRRELFWAAAFVVTFLVIYDFPEVGRPLRNALLFKTVPILRLHLFWLVPAIALATAALDDVRAQARGSSDRFTRGLPWALAAAGFAFAVAAGLHHVEDVIAKYPGAGAEFLRATGRIHVTWVGAAFALGLAGAAANALARTARVRALGGAALVAGHFAGTGLLLGGYAPTVPDRFVLPRTPAVAAVADLVGSSRLFELTHDRFPPNAALPYRIASVSSYDAIEIREFRELYEYFFGVQDHRGHAQRADRRGLELCGASYVAAFSDWMPIETLFSKRPPYAETFDPYLAHEFGQAAVQDKAWLELGAGELRQVFPVDRDGLSALAIRFAFSAEGSDQEIALEVRDKAAERSVHAATRRLRDMRHVPGNFWECVLRFPPESGSAGKRYELVVRALDPEALPRPRLLRYGLPETEGGGEEGVPVDRRWRLRDDDGAVGGRIVADLAFGEMFVPIERAAQWTLFRYTPSRGRAWCVAEAEVAVDRDDSLQRVCSAEFEPYRRVVLEGTGASARTATAELASKVEWLVDEPTRVALRVETSAPSHLVISQPHYPGWKARVRGVDAPLLRADHAFCALDLPAGTSEVELVFEPRSIVVGLAISAAFAALLVAVTVLAWKRRRATT